MKTIAVYNNKGGVGKTTTTKRLAMYLAEAEKKVLLIDMDPQSNLTSQFTRNVEVGMYEILLQEQLLRKVIRQTINSNIDIIPATMMLLMANNELMLESMSGKVPGARLKEKVFSLLEQEYSYDYVLIDCPPTMDLLVTNSLSVTDEVIIPLSVDNYSLDGIKMLLEKIDEVKQTLNPNLKISGVFLNRYKRSKIHTEMQSVISEILGDYVTNITIGDYAIINENTFTQDESKLAKHKVKEQFNSLFDSLEV